MVQQAFRVDQVSTSNIEFKSNSFISSIAADATLASNVHLVLPTSVGSSGQVLATDGSGNLSFVSQGVGGPADLVQDNVNSLTSTVDSFGVYANNTFGADGSNVSVANVTSQEFSIDGSTNTFTLVNTTDNVNKLLVSYGGIAQKPSEYAVSNTSLTLSNTRPLVAGTTVEVRYLDFEFSGSVTNSGNAGIVAGGATTVIAPFAFARVSSTTNASGTNISWSNWNSSNGTLDFTFSSAQSNTDYIVVSDAETFDDYYVGITNKTVNGFRASFYDGSGNRTPSSSAPFALIIYGATPTVDVNSLSGTSYSTTLYSNISSGVNTFNSASTPSLATYTAGKIGVYRNGVKLPATDYTATDGTSLVLNNATIEGDDIEVVNFGTVSVSLDDVTDVDLTTNAPANGQALIYVSANSKWEPGSVASSYGNSDVDTHLNQSTASTDQVLSWDGSDYAWVDQSAGGSSGASTPALTDYEFTAAANQTSFAATYIPGSVQVFLNGVKLANTEFTATSGTSIVLGSNTASGDTISVSKIGGSSNLTVANASASSTGSISYDSGSEVLTYTPPDLSGYQSTLVSNTNIKTINGNSVLGSGNITISSGGGVAGTLGSLTKSFANNESATITLSSNVSPVPNVSVFKEVPQQGFSSKGQWDVNANATNYDFYDEKPISYTSTTLTPSATGDGTFTSSSPIITSYDFSNPTAGATSTYTAPDWHVFAFNTTGTKLLSLDSGYLKLKSYNLSTAWDITTINSSAGAESTISTGDLYGATISADGTKLIGYVNANGYVYEYTMSTPFDVTTLTADGNTSSLGGASTSNAFNWFIKPGTYDTVYAVINRHLYKYTFTGGSIITGTVTRDANFLDLDPANQKNYINSGQLQFKPDGTEFYIGQGTDSIIERWVLSTAWDITTATKSSDTVPFTTAGNIWLKPDGTKIYYVDDGNSKRIDEYNIGSSLAFNAADVGKKVVGNSGSAIITSTSGTYKSVTAFADTSAISSWQLFGAQGKADASGIKITGSVIVNVDMDNDSYDNVSVSNGDTYNHSANAIYWDTFNDGVTRIYTASYQGNRLRILSSSSATADISSYTLQSAYDTIPGGCNGIYVPPDGSYVVLNRNGNDSFVKKTATTAYTDFGSDVYTSYTSLTNYASGLTFNADGSAFYIINLNNGGQVFKVPLSSGNEYTGLTDTSTWGTVESSATNLGAFGVTGNPLSDLRFNQDGTKLFITQQYGRRRFMQFNLSTPYDIRSTSMSFDSYQEHSSFGTGTDNRGLGFDFRPDFKKACFGDGHYASTTRQIYQYTFGVLDVTAPTNQYIPTLTNSSTGQINSSSWLDINSMTADETKNDGDIFYAVSTDNRASWSVAKASDGVRKIVKNNSGTWQYNNDGGTLVGFDYANATTTGNTLTVDVSNVGIAGGSNQGIIFSGDGTKFYLVYQSTSSNSRIYQVTLGTAWDLTSGTTKYTFNPSVTQISAGSIGFNQTGTALYIAWRAHPGTARYFKKFTLSTAWDLSTASSGVNSANLNSSGDFETCRGLTVGLNEEFIVTTDYASSDDHLAKFTFATAGDVTSNITKSESTNVTSYTNFPPVGSGNTRLTIAGPQFFDNGNKLFFMNYNYGGDAYIVNLTSPYDITSGVLGSTTGDISGAGTWMAYGVKPDGTRLYIFDNNNSNLTEYSTGTVSYATSETWVNGTNNNEHATLQQALTSQSFNRMDKAQLDAVADGYHFSQDSADTLDLMIAPYAASGTSPISDGVTINYDAEALVKQAINGTDYEAYFPSSNSVSITSLAAQNLKVRII